MKQAIGQALEARFETLLQPVPPERTGNQVALLKGGQDLFPRALKAIAQAQHAVRIETYIFASDAMGEAFCEALCHAALRGVQVRLVLDGFGGKEGVEHHVPRLKQAGVDVRIFRPEGSPLKLTPTRLRRMHRKIIAVDRQVAFVGGINLIDDLNHADEQHELRMAELREQQSYVHLLSGHRQPLNANRQLRSETLGPRYDFAVELQGPVVGDVWHSMEWLWWQVGPRGNVTDTFTAQWWAQRKQRLAQVLAEEAQQGPIAHQGAVKAQLVIRDNFRFRGRIEHSYIQALRRAHTSVVFANAYFLPSRRMRRAILAARSRGVVVKLLLQGRVEYAFQHHATQHLYDELLQHGVEVYEYTPSFLHAKVGVVDSFWATVGSSNLDPLSTLFAREANVVVHNRAFAQQLKAELLHAIAHHSHRIDPELHRRRPWRSRAFSWVCYKLTQLAVFVTAFGSRY
ncbi:MAG TPA: phospholipase D-like domain-containing protein [Limnobacter sp.]|uniref:phospholipase D-like domain-containing protein n=1 Tax=Limnobacter sp. TaxID=2003368 RepID=UPI002ED8E37C